METGSAMIEVAHLTKRFGSTTAVDDLTFSVQRREIVGFLGLNGAGKTTTLRILAGYLPPTRGTVAIGGLDVVRNSLEVRRLIGYLPENVPLYPDMRVHEYLHYRAKLKGLRGLRRRNRVNDVLEQCGLAEVSRLIVGHLSKGYRQRVGLADSLVHEPPLLLLDEPTIGLDPNQIRHARSLILSLSERHTVLLSTHILSEVEMMCGRVLILHRGRIIASDSPQRLIHRMKGAVELEAEIRGPLPEVLAACRGLHGVLNAAGAAEGDWNRVVIECERDADVRAELFGMVAAEGWALRELRSAPGKSLEDVFVSLTAGGPPGEPGKEGTR